MLIKKDGSIDKTIKGVAAEGFNNSLDDNQFLQETKDGTKLELWEGKKEFLENKAVDTNIQRIHVWNICEVIGYY